SAAVDAAARCPSVDVVVAPSFVLIDPVVASVGDARVAVAAQDVSEHAKGAFTGEVSGSMLAEAGCRLALVGHSERRQLHAETSDGVARKFVAAQAAGLIPVLCIGETREERE